MYSVPGFHRSIPMLCATVICLAVLAACSGDKPDPQSQAAPRPAAESAPRAAAPAAPPETLQTPRTPCEMINAQELLAATGITAPGESSRSGNASVCTWSDPTGAIAIVQLYPTAVSYESSRTAFESLYGGKSENVDGLGDAAFYIGGMTASLPTATISVRKGELAASIQVLGAGQDPGTLKDRALALTRTVTGKL
ncbi:DUF3558 family protein [Candidatus Fermentibacteria bacterium]|nr:DUF3558 family protein [Candidatus Fermentibacteria bacterium]